MKAILAPAGGTDKTAEAWYRVRKTWANAKSQKGAFKSLSNAKKCAEDNPGYSVFDESGKALYTSYAASTTGKLPIVCHTLGGRVTTYADADCTRISGYIDSVDLTKITAIYPDKGSVRVSYPTSRGTKPAYAGMSAFFSDIYPTSRNNYKMGWVNGMYDFGTPSYQTNDIGGEFSVILPKVNQENEKPSSVVNYMNSMATVAWTPSVDFRHWSYGQSDGNSMVWKAGITYYGIPYSQKTRTTTLEKFQSCLSGNVYIGPSGQNTYLGSDCSSAVAMAYHTVNTGFNAASITTSVLYPVAGYTKAVGNYYNNNWRSSSTVIRNNSKDPLKKAMHSCSQAICF